MEIFLVKFICLHVCDQKNWILIFSSLSNRRGKQLQVTRWYFKDCQDIFNTHIWVIPGTHPMSCNCYQYWPATKYGKYLGSAPQFYGLIERKVMISFQDNGNFLVPLTSSKKTESKKLLLSTMLKDHVGQGGQNRYNLKRDEDAFRFQYSCHAFHIMDRVVFKRKMEWMANSIELFEKELSLVHHINRLETWDTRRQNIIQTKTGRAIFPHTGSLIEIVLDSAFSCRERNAASSVKELNWKQFKVHVSNSSCGSGNGKEYWIGRE